MAKSPKVQEEQLPCDETPTITYRETISSSSTPCMFIIGDNELLHTTLPVNHKFRISASTLDQHQEEDIIFAWRRSLGS